MIVALLLATQTLAVLEFKSKVEEKGFDAGYFADKVRSTALEALPGVQVMTRENVVVLLEAQGKKLEDCEGECEVDTGRLLGADYVVTGELFRVGSSYKLNLKMHETAS